MKLKTPSTDKRKEKRMKCYSEWIIKYSNQVQLQFAFIWKEERWKKLRKVKWMWEDFEER
jgi:hypothetical protein